MPTIKESASNSTTVKNDSTNVVNPITTTDVKFHEDTISAFVGTDGEIYAAAKQILRNIGFDEERCKSIRRKWSEDEVVSTNGANFPLSYSNAVGTYSHETFCLPHKILPLALAKISITPTLKKDYPAVVEKLISYQTECADVLYKHFFQNKTDVKPVVYNDPNIPITREELSLYFTAFLEEEKTSRLDLINAVDKRMNIFEKQYTKLSEGYDMVKEGYKDIRNALTAISKSNETVNNGYVNLENGYKTIKDTLSASESRSRKIETGLSELILQMKGYTNNQSNGSNEVLKENINPVFHNSFSYEETVGWLKEYWRAAEKISDRTGKHKNSVVKEVYGIMDANGVNTTALFKEYREFHPTICAKANMVADSDVLRSKAEDAIRCLYLKYFPDKYKTELKEEIKSFNNETVKATESKVPNNNLNQRYTSQIIRSTPDSVRVLMNKVAEKHKWNFPYTAAQVYKEIEKRTNKNLKELARSYAEKIGFTNCSAAYYISKNSKMMEILKVISEEY